MSAFVLATVVIVALMFTAAVVASRAQARTVEKLQATAPTIKRWGGVLLAVVGAWFLALALFADTFARVFPV